MVMNGGNPVLLKNLTIEDVAVLREPLVSGRQSRNALSGALFFGGLHANSGLLFGIYSTGKSDKLSI